MHEIGQTKTQTVKRSKAQKCKYPGHHVLTTVITIKVSFFSCGPIKFGSYFYCCFGERWYLCWCLLGCGTVQCSITGSYNITMYVIAPEYGIICANVADYVSHSNRRLSQSLAVSLYRSHTECGVVDMCPSCTELLLTTE